MDDPGAKPFSQGFGLAEPKVINLGGDPTGLVTNITWSSWGGNQATAAGTGYYDPPSVPVAGSIPAPATVVAFNLGTCQGTLMYQALEWYFPTKGEKFDPGTYWNICTRTRVSPS